MKFLADAPETESPLLTLVTTSFDTAVLFILRNEGGYSNEPADAGGPTNYGITQREYEVFKGRHVSISEMKAMPLADAKTIYRSKYWIPEFEKLAQGVATAIMDWGVLHGTRSARIMAQQSANKLGCKLECDGDIGPKSIAAFNSIRPAYFVTQYASDIRAWMENRVKESPSQKVFLKGWLRRADRIATLA